MIAARGLRFAFGAAHPVLDAVDVDVGPGDLVALFGPNGAGKSTLVRLLAGELAPSAGAVELDGRPVATTPRRARALAIAVVPQEPIGPFPYTVGEVVLMGRAPRVGRFSFERDEDVEAARRALEAVDLLPLRDRPVGEISGGERQRAVLARALAQEAPHLLLDEPTAFLDVRHQVDVYRLLARLAREERRAVLVASHDIGLAARFATRVVLLKAGRVRAAGPPGEVLRREVLEDVFDAEVEIAPHPRTGRPIIIFGGEDD